MKTFLSNTAIQSFTRAGPSAALLAFGGSAIAASFDANIEFDNTYRSGDAVVSTDQGLSQSGRVEFNASGKAGADMFVAGRASFLAKKDGTAGTDDMWIQLGSTTGDVKLGRFEAADLFPLVGDTLINHAGNVYRAQLLRGRKDKNLFHAAGTLNLGGGLSLELGVVETRNGVDASGVRPVLAYIGGPFSMRLGAESIRYASGRRASGAGVTAGYDFGGFKLTGNLASGQTDADAHNKQSALGITVAIGGFSLGGISAITEQGDALGELKVQTAYAAYAIPLFGIKGATVTPALSSSTAKNDVIGTSIQENSLRVRFNYVF